MTRRRRKKHRDDDLDDIKWPVTTVKHDKYRNGDTLLDEPPERPTPFDAYQYGAVGDSPAPATPGPQHQDLPAVASSRYTNPWGSTPPSTEAAGRSTSPPAAPTSEGSVYSGTAPSASEHSAGRRALQVRNLAPTAPAFPPGDIKDRTVFLSADRGLHVAPGAASGSASGAQHSPVQPGQAGPSSSSEAVDAAAAASAPFQHQDAGAVPIAQARRPQKAAEARSDAVDHVDAPPAYEA
ncbi:uncharacterized protein PHACADRAFT_255339 [Phanerochaete carnosa HHB-10118-sp]|uniref:Uncharacterized protein n=1 Tax=Phanerochaete carnosa (strain HHB-10118-sp) TaxID=650164 RepID=K5VU36_PHACS|nr:uncharacterized protein PHACADRAFT_255339 [Phanerochaete carnosa HHB-10118-sp]EKM55028.1 hypothetical protein PHACADRAFT_255339 [Phanerochaete carnosa HHB-10118-sp]